MDEFLTFFVNHSVRKSGAIHVAAKNLPCVSSLIKIIIKIRYGHCIFAKQTSLQMHDVLFLINFYFLFFRWTQHLKSTSCKTEPWWNGKDIHLQVYVLRFNQMSLCGQTNPWLTSLFTAGTAHVKRIVRRIVKVWQGEVATSETKAEHPNSPDAWNAALRRGPQPFPAHRTKRPIGQTHFSFGSLEAPRSSCHH